MGMNNFIFSNIIYCQANFEPYLQNLSLTKLNACLDNNIKII